MNKFFNITLLLFLVLLTAPFTPAQGQDDQNNNDNPDTSVQADAGPSRMTLIGKKISFDSSASSVNGDVAIQEIFWDFGDGTTTTGTKVSHAYTRPGTFKVRLVITSSLGQSEDSTSVDVFSRVMILLTDNNASDEQLNIYQQQAAQEKLLLLVIKSKSGGPEALVEEDLTKQLVNAREEVSQANIITAWTSGSVGANVLSKFGQHIKQADELSFNDLDMNHKGIFLLTDTPFAVLSPTSQSTFDQLRPEYVALARPDALPLLFSSKTAADSRENIIAAQIEHRLFGTFSSRAVSDIGPTNFMSFGINYLVNRGVPINNILLILMIPVITTILSFARQVIGIKAFGLITPAMTTLSFLVMGLQTGLIVFVVVLLSGTLTRLLLRRLHLLYLPRMALVLTTASLAILVLLGISAATGKTATLSFSIFPILILTILAEEFIAVQFTRGLRTALRITVWTLVLVIISYFIVSWQLLRTLLLSYPETILLAIPINIILGRFSGLRLTEYLRFRELLRYTP
ncbi:MAG: 7TM domain-containing protein [Candidatus Andersenbacteria bacterium]|nr:7TM domain-containing protein [bacterium]MDZ4225648.1 7TM domain-containing protein [Candidatus Andersenbacteria bacterium]